MTVFAPIEVIAEFIRLQNAKRSLRSVVTSRPESKCGAPRSGVVAAASYEAWKFGVRSSMPSITAKRQCPDLIFVKPRFDAYRAVSLQIREIFAEHTHLIEPWLLVA